VDVTLSPHLAVNFILDHLSITWLCFIFTLLLITFWRFPTKIPSLFGVKCVSLFHLTTMRCGFYLVKTRVVIGL
jgi:hypothetical protein